MSIYELIELIGKYAKDNAIVVSDAGSAFYATAQAFPFRDGMRHVTDGGQAAMGAALPMALGAHHANKKRQVIVITGDGSFMFCMATAYSLMETGGDIKVFVVCNGGYLSLKRTQEKFFDGRYVGVMEGLMPELAFPEAYSIPEDDPEYQARIKRVMELPGTLVVMAHTDPNEHIRRPML